MKKLLVLGLCLTLAAGVLTGCQKEQKPSAQTSVSQAEVSSEPEQKQTQENIFETQPDGFRIVTIGTGNPKFDTNAGGNSTLVQYKDKYFLVDCGAMSAYTLANAGLPITSIDNILFTHQHNDHNADFWTYFVGGWGDPKGRRQLDLIGPGVQNLYDMTVDFYRTDLEYRSNGVGFSSDGVLTNVEIRDLIKEKDEFELDGVKIKAMTVPHTIEAYAYRFEADGQSIVISGDMMYKKEFAEFAKGADIVVMDGMLTSDFSDLPEEAREGMKASLKKSHITSEEIGELMAQAQPGKLVLSHLGGAVDIDAVSKAYKEQGYKGETILAHDGMSVEP